MSRGGSVPEVARPDEIGLLLGWSPTRVRRFASAAGIGASTRSGHLRIAAIVRAALRDAAGRRAAGLPIEDGDGDNDETEAQR